MLEDLELFSSLTPGEINDIVQITQRMEFRRGEYVFQQGERSRDLYVIENGQVELTIKDALQEPKVLATLKNGDLFGEMALFDASMVRSASARSLQNSILLVIPGDKFEQLLKEKPAISFKLLGILSKRVKDSNQQAIARTATKKTEARIITVASPRNGVGKTTFAVTLAQILSMEKGARTLFIDLDMPFADGSFALGLHSVRTVVEFTQAVRGGISNLDMAKKLLIQVKNNLSCLPGPVNLFDGEKVDPKALSMGIRQLQKYFDFIILDTDSHIEELFLSAIDLADRVFFLVDAGTSYSLKSSVRYFFGLSKLNLPGERMTLLAGRNQKELDLKALSGLFKLPVKAQLPIIDNHTISYGGGILISQNDHPFCQTIRKLLPTSFPVEFQENRPAGFFSRLFGGGDSTSEGTPSALPDPAQYPPENLPKSRETNIRAMTRLIRAWLVAGHHDKARTSIIHLLETTSPSSQLYQAYGELLVQEGNLSEATDAFRKAVQLDPSNHLSLGYAAIFTLDQNEFALAIAILSKKIEKHPTWPDLRRDLGELYLRNNRPEDAIAPFQQALTINPRYEDAQIRLAEAHQHLGKFQDALDILNGMKEKSAPVLYLMGICLQSINRFAEALEAFRLLQKISPSFRDVNSRINELQGYFDKLHSLIAMHQKIRQEQPAYLDIRIRLAQLLASAGRREEALAECRAALRINPCFAQAQEEIDHISQFEKIVLDQATPLVPPKPSIQNMICNEFLIEIDFGKFGANVDFHERLANHTIEFRNVRTGKMYEFRLPVLLAQKMQIFASSLCPVTENDLIQIRMVSPQSREILFSDSRVIEHIEKSTAHLLLNLENPIQRVVDSLPRFAPIRNFLIGISMKDNLPLFAINTRTDVRAEARGDIEQGDRSLFVLRSLTDEDVVKTDDILEIRSSNEQERVLMKFRITPDDLAANVRFIEPEGRNTKIEA